MEQDFTIPEVVDSFINDLKQKYMEMDKENINISSLLILIQDLLKALEQIVIIEGNSLKYTKEDLIVNNTENAFLQLMTFSGQLVYQIRSLLLKEDIDYFLGGQSSDGSQLYTKILPQSAILNNIKADLNSGAVLLKAELEKFTNQDKVAKHINFLWQQIQSLSDISYSNKEALSEKTIFAYTFTNKSGKTINAYRHYYQKPTNDKNVFMRYKNQRTKKEKYSYYNKDGKMFFFNNGWLYEWFQDYLAQHGFSKLASSLIDNQSLSVMMKKTDRVEGYKGGDFMIGKQQIQAKFKNLRIISFKSVITVLTNLKEGLILYQEALSPEKKEQAIEKIAQIFVADNIEKINKSTTETALNVIKETFKNATF